MPLLASCACTLEAGVAWFFMHQHLPYQQVTEGNICAVQGQTTIQKYTNMLALLMAITDVSLQPDHDCLGPVCNAIVLVCVIAFALQTARSSLRL